jgi:hypothetical protein
MLFSLSRSRCKLISLIFLPISTGSFFAKAEEVFDRFNIFVKSFFGNEWLTTVENPNPPPP